MGGKEKGDEHRQVLDPEPGEVHREVEDAIALPIRIREPAHLQAVTTDGGPAAARIVVDRRPHPDQDRNGKREGWNEVGEPLAPPVERCPERGERDDRSVRMNVEGRHEARHNTGK